MTRTRSSRSPTIRFSTPTGKISRTRRPAAAWIATPSVPALGCPIRTAASSAGEIDRVGAFQDDVAIFQAVDRVENRPSLKPPALDDDDVSRELALVGKPARFGHGAVGRERDPAEESLPVESFGLADGSQDFLGDVTVRRSGDDDQGPRGERRAHGGVDDGGFGDEPFSGRRSQDKLFHRSTFHAGNHGTRARARSIDRVPLGPRRGPVPQDLFDRGHDVVGESGRGIHGFHVLDDLVRLRRPGDDRADARILQAPGRWPAGAG